MLKKCLAFSCIFILYFVVAQDVNSQGDVCQTNISCVPEVIPNGVGCKNTWRRVLCDGSSATTYSQCTNTGCIAGCECDCIAGVNGGYTQAWENTCTQVVHNITKVCEGCPGWGCNPNEPGWFYYNGTNQCVPPACQDCIPGGFNCTEEGVCVP